MWDIIGPHDRALNPSPDDKILLPAHPADLLCVLAGYCAFAGVTALCQSSLATTQEVAHRENEFFIESDATGVAPLIFRHDLAW